MIAKIESSWEIQLDQELNSYYFKQLTAFIIQEMESHIVYPPIDEIFNAFNCCPFVDTKVVILGQDPYHGSNQAHGLCFSVKAETKLPPSLKNIFKEVANDMGSYAPENGDLTRWAKQGILLLNAALTVRSNEAGSHQNHGWEQFTDAVIARISEQKSNVVFILWGSYAQRKGAIIDRTKHLVLEAVHPSPLSAHRGFFGNNHFSKTNQYLIDNGLLPVAW